MVRSVADHSGRRWLVNCTRNSPDRVDASAFAAAAGAVAGAAGGMVTVEMVSLRRRICFGPSAAHKGSGRSRHKTATKEAGAKFTEANLRAEWGADKMGRHCYV